MRMFIAQFAALSAFNLSYRIGANGEPSPEGTRNFWDAISIYIYGIKPKDKKKGKKKTSFNTKAIAKNVQDLGSAIFFPE